MQVWSKGSLGDYFLNSDGCNRYTNAEVTITLRLGFRQVNPTASKQTQQDFSEPPQNVRIIPWTEAYWLRWIKDFVHGAEHFWNKRFWLTNNYPVLEIDSGGVKYRPNVECKLDLIAETAQEKGGYHHVINAVRLRSRGCR